MLQCDEILSENKNRKIIDPLNEENLQPTTYDLTVHYVMDSAGKVHSGNEYHLLPLDIVWVVSKEIISLPGTITAHTTLKNGISRKGILALNTGIIDPHYTGPISTAMVNFSKERCILRDGEPFLRLTFFRHPKANEKRCMKFNHEQYRRVLQEEVVTRFAPDFLNIKTLTEEVAKKAVEKITSRLVTVASILVFVVAVLALAASAFFSGTMFAHN